MILSHDVFNERSGTVIAVALTSQEPRAGYRLTLELTTHKFPKRSWVKVSQIRTLSSERIGKRLGRAADEELGLVREGLFEIVGELDGHTVNVRHQPRRSGVRRAVGCMPC